MNSITSAVLRAGRPPLPAKIMSSISPPRMDVGRVSPMTQRSASNRLDLPQPFGPMMAVNPGSMKSSVGSTNDLNPDSLSRANLKVTTSSDARLGLLLQLGIQEVLHLLPIGEDGMDFAIDDESRCAIDPVAGRCVLTHFRDSLLLRLIPDASVDLLSTQSRDSAHLDKAAMHVLNAVFRVPFGLIPEEQVNELEIVIRRKTAGHCLSGKVARLEREHPEDVVNLPSINVVRLQLGEKRFVEVGAMRANGRRILNDLDGRFRRAHRAVIGSDRNLPAAAGVRSIVRGTVAAIEREIGGYKHRDHRDADNPIDQLISLHEEAPNAFDKALVAEEDGPFNPGAAGSSGGAP